MMTLSVKILFLLIILNLGLFYSTSAQMCYVGGFQTGNFGSGGSGFSNIYRQNLNNNAQFAINNNTIIRVGGVSMAGMNIKFDPNNSNAPSGKPIIDARKDSISPSWRITLPPPPPPPPVKKSEGY